MASCALYTANTSVAVDDGSQIPLGSIIRRFKSGCHRIDLNGNAVSMLGAGYYMVSVSVSETPTATGPVAVQLYQDGSAVPGAYAVAQGTAAEPVSLSFTCLLRNCGIDSNSAFYVTTSAAGVIDSVSTVTTKE